MKILPTSTLLPALGLLMTGTLAADTRPQLAPAPLREFYAEPTTPAQIEISRQLRELRALALETRRQVAEVKNLLSSTAQSEAMSHNWRWGPIRDEMNRMGRIAMELKAMEAQATPWQREAIRVSHDLLAQVATQGTKALESLKLRTPLQMVPAYRAALLAIDTHTDNLVDILGVKMKMQQNARKAVDIERSLAANTVSD